MRLTLEENSVLLHADDEWARKSSQLSLTHDIKAKLNTDKK